jgi:hypothetical protein
LSIKASTAGGVELSLNRLIDTFLTGFVLRLGKDSVFQSVFRKDRLKIASVAVMQADGLPNPNYIMVEYNHPFFSHLFWFHFFDLAASASSISYATSIRFRSNRFRSGLIVAPGQTFGWFVALSSRGKVNLPLFNRIKFQGYATGPMDPTRMLMLHAAVSLNGRERRGMFLSVTNNIFEVGAQWATWTDHLIKTSLLTYNGQFGVKFSVTGRDAPPERKYM